MLPRSYDHHPLSLSLESMHSHVNITPSFHFSSLNSTIQSEIEEALVRIKNLEGVEGYVVCNNEGTVLRHQADMDKKVAEELAKVCCGVSPRDKIKSGLATSFALLLLTLHYPQHHLSISISFSSSPESNQTSITSYQCRTRSRS